MPDRFVFVDEAGCFTFSRSSSASRYYAICTVVLDTCDIGNDLLRLRRKLAWEGYELGDFFHAAEDKQPVRDMVFATLQPHRFDVQVTVMEKSKAQPQVTVSRERFYQYGYYYHFKRGVAPVLPKSSEVLVTTACIGTRRERAAFQSAVRDVMRQTRRVAAWKPDFMPATADPCLQVVDYCAWAIQRKWERGDDRSYRLIAPKISYEADLWAHGKQHYY